MSNNNTAGTPLLPTWQTLITSSPRRRLRVRSTRRALLLLLGTRPQPLFLLLSSVPPSSPPLCCPDGCSVTFPITHVC